MNPINEFFQKHGRAVLWTMEKISRGLPSTDLARHEAAIIVPLLRELVEGLPPATRVVNICDLQRALEYFGAEDPPRIVLEHLAAGMVVKMTDNADSNGSPTIQLLDELASNFAPKAAELEELDREDEDAINAFVVRAHENAVRKGFHEVKTPNDAQRAVAIYTTDVYMTAFLMEMARTGKAPVVADTRIWFEHVTDEQVVKLSMYGLMITEIAEAIDEMRLDRLSLRLEAGKPEGEVVELADLVIRVFDYAGRFQLDLGSAVLKKMAFNEKRPKMHGGKLL